MSPQFPRSMPLWQRIIEGSIDDVNGCRAWTRGRTKNGYGAVWANGRTHAAHRVSYEAFVGPIPDGAVIDHTCRNRQCVRPSHMEIVTRGENVRRGRHFGGNGGVDGAAVVVHPVNHPHVDRTPAERDRIERARWLLDGRFIRRRDVVEALAALGTPIAAPTLSLYRFGHMCPSETNLQAIQAAIAALLGPAEDPLADVA